MLLSTARSNHRLLYDYLQTRTNEWTNVTIANVVWVCVGIPSEKRHSWNLGLCSMDGSHMYMAAHLIRCLSLLKRTSTLLLSGVSHHNKMGENPSCICSLITNLHSKAPLWAFHVSSYVHTEFQNLLFPRLEFYGDFFLYRSGLDCCLKNMHSPLKMNSFES